jgi:hypothetical protein
VSLSVLAKKPFRISGDVVGTVIPGSTAPIAILLSNDNNFAIDVVSLAVQVEEATNKAGCSGTQNFSPVQIPAVRYPFTIPGNGTRTLSGADRPQITMLNRAVSQDACKGAQFRLQYSGTATK